MALIVSVGLFLLLAAFIGGLAWSQYARKAAVYRQIRTVAVAEWTRPQAKAGNPANGLFHWLGRQFPVSAEGGRLARRDLVQAGYRSDNALTIYYGVRIFLA